MSKQSDREWLAEHVTGVDKLIARKNGTFELQRGYYYRMNQTAERWGNCVATWTGERFELVEAFDHFAPWPKRSYFSAVLRRKEDVKENLS